ncbi:TPA: hypothetical protein ACGSTL_001211 [Vibrio parahaemolyticus]|uniref:hypothetical protein n=1 Tax=Vibrio campbellii TaxID=680 RepID=UPI001F08592E|nr:hypothetical protein [Vibrio campbellii]UMM06630.1 hypothetical protein MKR81_27165 [Vibrio campbellii]
MPAHRKYSLFLKPSSQGLFWFLTFCLAAYASVFSTEIKSVVWPESFATAMEMTINFHTVFFTVGATLAAIFVSFSVWVKSKREDFLFAVVQTSPPAGFWKRHHQATLRANENSNLVELWVADGDKEECEKAVRVALDDLLNLVMEWDEANLARKVDYRANIMRVVHFQDEPNYQIDPGLDRFLHKPERDHYSGVVVLEDNTYSTTTKTTEPLPDPEIKPILFPFTNKDEEHEHMFHTNLRGAPYAVASGSHCYVEDVEEIVDHYTKHAEPFSSKIKAKLEEYYFKKDYPAHSILSIPLFGINKAQQPVVKYVLNLYRNQPGMLYKGEKAKEFFYVATGLTSKLESMLAAIHDTDDRNLAVIPSTTVDDEPSKVEETA